MLVFAATLVAKGREGGREEGIPANIQPRRTLEDCISYLGLRYVELLL